MSKIIISCAITGSIHTPSMSPHLPVTADEIATSAIGAAAAGASILHLHARDPADGRPSADPDHWAAFLPRIKEGCDAVVNMTTGGSAIMTLDQRLAAPIRFAPEMCSLNMGTMNFALYPMAARIKDWKHAWERPFLENSDDLVFKNTPRDIAHVLAEMGARGARFEFECYDMSHLYMLRHFVDRGAVKGPLFLQFVFGVLGGMAADPDMLVLLRRTAERLFGEDTQFSVLAAGRQQIAMATMAASMGGHVRVGLEDNLYLSKGVLAPSNAAQVTLIRTIAERLGREVATPAETRAILALKGAAGVRF
ncbi:MAG: 3-keto-5-aminohexanoate cleavage protein [Paracoccaceae bacterium]